MKNVSLGRYSVILAASIWLFMIVGAVVILTNQLFFFTNHTGSLLLTIWLYGGLALAMVGIGLAVGGLMQVGQKRVAAASGLVLNGFVLLAGLWVLSMSR